MELHKNKAECLVCTIAGPGMCIYSRRHGRGHISVEDAKGCNNVKIKQLVQVYMLHALIFTCCIATSAKKFV